MSTDRVFFVGQKAFIEKDGKILTVLHPEKGLDFPGGKIQDNEDPENALKREVMEETGLQIEILEPFNVWLHPTQNIYLVGFACRYKSGEIMLNEEHIKYEWVNKNAYMHIKDPSGYKKALIHYFQKYQPNLSASQ